MWELSYVLGSMRDEAGARMTGKERAALVDLIEQFKPAVVSTLDAALNVLTNHAATIKAQAEEIRELRAAIDRAANIPRRHLPQEK